MMEDVDRIIVHSLKEIGCDIEDGVECLKQFSTELVVEATVKCLNQINADLKLPHRLPPGVTARFRVGSALAQGCTDLGYPGEIGYQTFLYWGEVDIRRVLMFLIEKLPKETEKIRDEPLGATTLLNRQIAEEVRNRLRAPWVPSQLAFKGVRWLPDCKGRRPFRAFPTVAPRNLEDVTCTIPKELKQYYAQFMEVVTNQPPSSADVAASLIEGNTICLAAAQCRELDWNQKGLSSRLTEQEYSAQKRQKLHSKLKEHMRHELQKCGASTEATGLNFEQLIKSVSEAGTSRVAPLKESRFMLTEKLVFTKEASQEVEQVKDIPSLKLAESEEDLRRRHKEEEVLLHSQISDMSAKLDSLQLEAKKINGSMQQMQELLTTQNFKNRELHDAHAIIKKTFDLLPNAEENLLKLQAVVEATAQRLVSLAGQWERHRAPLVERYRQLRELNADRVSENQRKLEEIRSLREMMKELAEEARVKEELQRQLAAEYEKMTRDVNRSAYTRRILEIVNNIKKQKQDIDKVLIDTKEVQKEINQLSGKLDRTFTVTDELVFKDAKKDESVRQAYKYLAALHENCNLLVKTVEETGAIMREIRDLEDQIDNESQKKVLANLERITADHKQMKQENAALLAKLKERQ